LDTFDLEDAFEVLEAMMQTITRFSLTRVSFAALPERNLLFLMLAGDFSRIWQIDLNEMTIETHRGFTQYRIEDLSEYGITFNPASNMEVAWDPMRRSTNYEALSAAVVAAFFTRDF